MGTLIDSSLWVDYFRAKTPAAIKRQVVQFIDSADAMLCEPIWFEILRAAHASERASAERAFATLPLLPAPADIWEKAIKLGQRCVDAGIYVHGMDLLIAVICLDHEATLVTFDSHFPDISKVCPLKVHLLSR